ncbi:restriction endonuclease-like protein [Clostridium estertheticum]|nr:restriction endonuclease-like protein [Clostridium estertheticum]
MKVINIVLAKPHHELIKDSRVCKYQSLKNTSMDTIKWLEKRPHLLEHIDGRNIPTQALQVTKKVTLDTKENRFLKFMLITIIHKIDSFIRTYSSTPWKKNEDIINKLNTMKKAINNKLKTSFLKDVGSDYRNTSMSLVFNMASGYREIYKYYLMLQKGLSINSNIFSLSMKELSLLYEYWCFIKINSLLRKRYKLISTDFISINRTGIFVSLKKGVTSTLVYENPNTKETFKVSYNAFKSRKASNLAYRTEGSKTVTQKPDNMLSVNKLGSDKAYEFVFDAKYKIDTSINTRKVMGALGLRKKI